MACEGKDTDFVYFTNNNFWFFTVYATVKFVFGFFDLGFGGLLESKMFPS